MDYAASRRVQQLVTSLTDPKASSLDDDKLTELKALLRQSEELVAYATPLLIDRLGASHSQVVPCNQPKSAEAMSCTCAFCQSVQCYAVAVQLAASQGQHADRAYCMAVQD